MMMTASTALVTGRTSYLRLRNFTAAINVIITLLMLLLVVPPVFQFVAGDVMRLPPPVVSLTHAATTLLLPWPAAIGFRRFYQGLLIRFNLTNRVAWGTLIRLIAMTIAALTLALTTTIPGAVVGACALSTGVLAELIASRFMVRSTISALLKRGEVNGPALSYAGIWHFYNPLALTSVLALGVHPMVAFSLGQSRMPLESLAVMPVINSLVFVFRSFGLSYQEVAVSQMGRRMQHFAPVRTFAIGLGIASMLGIGLVAFTPFAHFWFRDVSGLSMDLALFALLPTQLLVLMPGTSVLLAMQRSVLVVAKKTGAITTATIIEVGLILAVLYVTIAYWDAIGAVAAAIALVIGRLGANAYLARPVSNALKSGTDKFLSEDVAA